MLDVGTVLPGGFRIDGSLGRGSLAEVYAVSGPAGDLLALKLLHEQFVADRDAVARFEVEADMLASVNHPALVAYHARGAWGRRPFVVMQRAVGHDLASELSQSAPLSESRAQAIGCGVLDGLIALHQHGLVHRDIKPANVFVSSRVDGVQVQLIDLGSGARIVAGAVRQAFDSDRLTPLGRVIATPHYASPQSLTGVWDRDPRGDLYAVAVLMFQMLTGHLPFDHVDLSELIRRIVATPAPPVGVFGIANTSVSMFVERALAVDPDQRFPDAAAMRDALGLCR